VNRLRRVRAGNDEGFAMVLVIGFGLVLTLIVATLSEYTLMSVKTSRHDQHFHSSLAAAQAGVDDYLARLNQNNTYWQSTDCSNAAIRKPMTGSNPCSWTATTPVGWVTIPGSSDGDGNLCSATPTPVNCPVYHYEVNTSTTPVNGTITVTATGKSRGVTRTVQEVLRRVGFGDFLYYSDYETTDPANPVWFGVNNTTAATQCTRHYWDNPSRTSMCVDINFVTGDTLNGPLHTNDAMLIAGNPVFNGAVTTAYTSCAPVNNVAPAASACYRANGAAAPTFAKGVTYAAKIDLPPTNSAIKAQVVASTAIGTPGCLYTGPTRIHFNTAGTMTVTSPYSLTLNPGCGTAPITSAQTIAVPNNNVIVVQNVPSTQASPSASASNCNNGGIYQTAIGYPQTGDYNITYGSYNCRNGNVFVDGDLAGRVTIAADNNVVIVDNLTYAGGAGGTDALGLVANNAVELYHPITCTQTGNQAGSFGCTAGSNMARPNGTTWSNPVVNAAMLSLLHSFGVQNYQVGNSLGNLRVFGAISQKFRGAVGTFGQNGSTGYLKDYNYDNRLRYAPPPFYLDPIQSSYARYTFGEVQGTVG
jgi:Tfp pilus assembly protein PilX